MKRRWRKRNDKIRNRIIDLLDAGIFRVGLPFSFTSCRSIFILGTSNFKWIEMENDVWKICYGKRKLSKLILLLFTLMYIFLIFSHNVSLLLNFNISFFKSTFDLFLFIFILVYLKIYQLMSSLTHKVWAFGHFKLCVLTLS